MDGKTTRRNLSDAFLRKLKPPEAGRIEIGDTRVPALIARVTKGPDGRAVIVFSCRFTPKGEKRRRPNIGVYGPDDMTLAGARQRTREILVAARRGIDLPRKEIDDRKAAERAGRTVADLVDEYVPQYCKPNLRSWRSVELLLRNHVVPAIGARALPVLERAHIAEMLDKLQNEKGLTAQRNRIRTRLVGMFTWAIERGWMEHNPAAVVKHRKSLEKARSRVLSPAELRAVWRAAGDIPYPGGPLVRTLMLTGFRRDEARAAMWAEIDIEAQTWKLPAGRNKGKREFELPLSPAMVALLRELPERRPHVFSLDGRRPYTNLKALKAQLDEKSGVHGWVLHDLRRSFRTELAALDVPEEIAERLLNHAQPRWSRPTTATSMPSKCAPRSAPGPSGWPRSAPTTSCRCAPHSAAGPGQPHSLRHPDRQRALLRPALAHHALADLLERRVLAIGSGEGTRVEVRVLVPARLTGRRERVSLGENGAQCGAADSFTMPLAVDSTLRRWWGRRCDVGSGTRWDARHNALPPASDESGPP